MIVAKRFGTLAIAGLLALTATLAAERAPRGEDEVIPPEVQVKTQVAPIFPAAARAARLSGVVLVRTTVQIDGTVGDAVAMASSHPNLGFEEAAVSAIRQWKFRPALLRGDPVEYTTSYRLHFGRQMVGGIPAPMHWLGDGTRNMVEKNDGTPGDSNRPQIVIAPAEPGARTVPR